MCPARAREFIPSDELECAIHTHTFARAQMHKDEKELYSDLLKAKIQYMKTHQYWDDK